MKTNKFSWEYVSLVAKLSCKLAYLYIKAEMLKIKLTFKYFILSCYFF